MAIQPLSPDEARQALSEGAILVDVRGTDEHARSHIPGALNVPLTRLCDVPQGQKVIFHCMSGMRTQANATQLKDAVQGDCYILSGGLNAWEKAGFPVVVDRHQPLELMRQVQLAAGFLALTGALLGWFVNPAFLWLSAFVGAGLMVAGATGWCGMAHLLRRMPWNRNMTIG
ncbi:MAG: DUF2892 domain-containing protein [Sphingobium sp.]|nr:DUF2892 domain-containing protein [Sphingobium sp.]